MTGSIRGRKAGKLDLEHCWTLAEYRRECGKLMDAGS